MVTETMLLTVAASLVATLFGVLVAMVGWLGNKGYNKLEDINTHLVDMAGELHKRINGLDRRITRVEAKTGIGTGKEEGHYD